MNTETLQLILQKVEEMNIGEKEYLEFANMTKKYYEKKRIDAEIRKQEHEETLKHYLSVLRTCNDAEYWKKKMPSKEKKEYLESVYGLVRFEREYIVERMNEHLIKAYNRFVKKVSLVCNQ